MPSLVVLVPGRLDAPTGGSRYDRHMVRALRELGWAIDVHELDASFPEPTCGALSHASSILASIPEGTKVLADGLAFCVMPDVVEPHALRLQMAALVHLPRAADRTLDRARVPRVTALERRALAAASLVVVTGTAAVPMLEPYALPDDKIVVIEPGTTPAPLARGSSGRTLQLLSVGSLTAGKGYDTLLGALAAVPHRHWRLTCVGSLVRDPETVALVRAEIERRQLADHIELTGELGGPPLTDRYVAADVYVSATRQETYGMAVAEALAHGLPVVATTTGAIPSLVGDHAGLLAAPGDVDALTRLLTRVLSDAPLRARLAAGARAVRQRLPSWTKQARRMAAVLEGLG